MVHTLAYWLGVLVAAAIIVVAIVAVLAGIVWAGSAIFELAGLA
ncbi:hypothetical protein I5G58_gp083 [Mycobacterium phage BirdsNest]|uniref:Uncharacterized protein n=1 Tax=Mycobacterium phage BirdsNest TaxID=2686231 RepID=A0A6B9LF75_9CAUD|nr:hypothetical protein I5G58_gp083 [Mycobacterium phage BirdsNest]QHB37385.1 hypothetical protein PBI_BIRDSNEST_83 [Mycobacterium phage BirdsNest]